jgi:hypothetical protein
MLAEALRWLKLAQLKPSTLPPSVRLLSRDTLEILIRGLNLLLSSSTATSVAQINLSQNSSPILSHPVSATKEFVPRWKQTLQELIKTLQKFQKQLLSSSSSSLTSSSSSSSSQDQTALNFIGNMVHLANALDVGINIEPQSFSVSHSTSVTSFVPSSISSSYVATSTSPPGSDYLSFFSMLNQCFITHSPTYSATEPLILEAILQLLQYACYDGAEFEDLLGKIERCNRKAKLPKKLLSAPDPVDSYLNDPQGIHIHDEMYEANSGAATTNLLTLFEELIGNISGIGQVELHNPTQDEFMGLFVTRTEQAQEP